MPSSLARPRSGHSGPAVSVRGNAGSTPYCVGMSARTVVTPGQLLRGNPLRLLASARPARAVAYVVTGALVGAVALAGLPFVALLSGLAGLPLFALPLAALERRRLALLGLPVPDSPHRTPRQWHTTVARDVR